MAERLLDYDPLSGLITWHDYDAATETTIIRSEQGVTALLDACKHDANHADRRLGDGAHVASIPAITQLEWLTKYGVDALSPDPGQRKKVARLLDGEYKHLKRLPIQIGGY